MWSIDDQGPVCDPRVHFEGVDHPGHRLASWNASLHSHGTVPKGIIQRMNSLRGEAVDRCSRAWSTMHCFEEGHLGRAASGCCGWGPCRCRAHRRAQGQTASQAQAPQPGCPSALSRSTVRHAARRPKAALSKPDQAGAKAPSLVSSGWKLRVRTAGQLSIAIQVGIGKLRHNSFCHVYCISMSGVVPR